MVQPHFEYVSDGPLEGCAKMNWGSNWGYVIIIILGCYSVLVPAAVKLSLMGYNFIAMVLYPVIFVLAISFIGPWCGINAITKGLTVQMVFIMCITSLAIIAGIVNAHKKLLTKDGPLGYLMNKRIFKSYLGVCQWDLYFVGPINEFLSMSLMEYLGFAVILTWLAVSVWARFTMLMDETYGSEYLFGNTTRAFGRAMTAATLRLLLLSLVSPSRNTIVLYFLGIPFDRAVKWHSIFGRLMVVCMYIHVIAMLIGGTEEGMTYKTGKDGEYFTNAFGITEMRQVKWNSKFTLYGSGTNLACGVIAFVFWNLLVLSSLPYVRRKLFETFYFLHFNFMFIANVMTVFHARAQVIPFIAPAFVLLYIDFSIRIVSKLNKVKATEVSVIGDNIVKLVLQVDNFPMNAFQFHPGSYVWLSCNLKSVGKDGNDNVNTKTIPYKKVDSGDKQVEMTVTTTSSIEGSTTTDDATAGVTATGKINTIDKALVADIFTSVKVPGGPPAGLPSWLFFHPITVTSYNEDSRAITLYIKAFGDGKSEWSGQLLAAANLIASHRLDMSDVSFHVGGPNGSLMIKEPLNSLDRVILISGGIGCTPMCAILEGLLKENYTGKVNFIWSTRTIAEIQAFKSLFSLCNGKSNFSISIYYTGKSDDDIEKSILGGSDTGYKVLSGRPNLEELSLSKGETTGVLCCGPEAMMINVGNYAVTQQHAGMSVLYHRETFEF